MAAMISLSIMYSESCLIRMQLLLQWIKERFVNKYDEWNDRTVFKLTANRRYIVDPSENAILYLNA